MTKLFTVKEVLDIFRISEPTFYNWKRVGKIRPIKIAGKNLISEEEINRIIKEAQEQTAQSLESIG